MTAPAIVAIVSWVAAMSPIERNHPAVEQGMSAFESGQFEAALEHFDRALADKPLEATAHYNRGVTLHKLGKNDEARSSLQRALELDTSNKLASKIHYNLGNVANTLGDRKEAILQYRRSLEKNPSDANARHNLEMLLKNVPPPSPQGGPDGGVPDGGNADGGGDGGRPDGGNAGDGGIGDGGQREPKSDGDGGRADAGRPQEAAKTDAGPNEDPKSPDAGIGEQPDDQNLDGGTGLSRQEAEKLLDSMKNSEKNLQLWRFKQKASSKTPHGKDW